jgi:peptidoglycan-N-acetylglucosamine deacetylase
MKLLYNPPYLLKRMFREFYWQTANKKILLTFDDGPNPGNTENILNTLNKLRIKALFFCVGENAQNHKELVKSILGEKHIIGNHTFNHFALTKLKYVDALNEISNFSSLMKTDYNFDVKFFRPPYGRINFSTTKLMNDSGLKCVMWNLLTYDYKKDLKKVKFAVDNYLQENSIIVLHDNLKSKNFIVEAIKYIADSASKKGFEFGSADECLK